MNFIESLWTFFQKLYNGLIKMFTYLYDILSKPLSYLYWFFDGVFYFISKLFEIVIKVITLFTGIFQFIFALAAGFMRTIISFLTFSPNSSDVSFPSMSNTGFGVVTDLLQPTGLMTVVPIVATAFLWFFFIVKMIGLWGGTISIRPFGSGGGEK